MTNNRKVTIDLVFEDKVVRGFEVNGFNLFFNDCWVLNREDREYRVAPTAKEGVFKVTERHSGLFEYPWSVGEDMEQDLIRAERIVSGEQDAWKLAHSWALNYADMSVHSYNEELDQTERRYNFTKGWLGRAVLDDGIGKEI